MSSKLKLYLGRKVIDCLQGKVVISQSDIKPLIQIGNQTDKSIELNLSLRALEDRFGIPNTNEIQKIQPDEIIKNITYVNDKNKRISFEINKHMFMKDTVENCTVPEANVHSKNIVVEFSSPNIAKPFHMGHLRSTIIGNFLSNLFNYLNHRVTKLNYLGDWGTQFGFIKVGMDDLNYTTDDIKTNPIKLLYESYVHANKLGESNPEILERAKQEFSKLESGSTDILNDWKMYVDYSKKELQSTYDRIGINFDEYHSESMYNVKDIKNVIDTLNTKNILHEQSDGKKIAMVNDRKVSVVKSDGSTLYLTRDIAAAIDRYKRYKFDKMYYVVENGQNDHFNALKSILHRMDLPWATRIHHVKFGRIRGMSTRKGTSIFLRDILDECRDLMIQKQLESPNTRVPITDSNVSDVLGISCVIINDLKQRRQKDYDFSWDRVLQVQGDSGVKLQYTHSRLCSLEENCGVTAAKECIPDMLPEAEALTLVRELARFHEIINLSEQQLEACVITTYLFHLCNHINKALKALQIKGMPNDIASQRLLVFNSAREVLGQGMTILGLRPLSKM